MNNVAGTNTEERRDTGAIALVGGTIIDGNGGAPLVDGVLLIDGVRISAVGDRSTPIPPHAQQISVTGKFIIPGFIGSPALILDGFTVLTFIQYWGRYDELALEAAQIALKNGMTTVFDIFTPRDDGIKLRTAINEGRVVGPRVHLCGGWVGCDGPFSADQNNRVGEALSPTMVQKINSRWECNIAERLTSMSPKQVREEIRKYIETGVDYLFVQVNVHRYGAQQFFQFSPRVLSAIVDEAHRAGLVVKGNCMYSEEGLWTAVDAGIDLPSLVYLSSPLAPETLDLLAQRQIPWEIHPFTREELDWWQRRTSQDDEWSRLNKSMHEMQPANEKGLIRAGVPILLGQGAGLLSADSQSLTARLDRAPPGNARDLGNAHFSDLLGAQELGMKPMEALQAVTRNVARAYKVDKDLGTLERGKFADLLILDRNPLENAANYRSISVVMKEGKIIGRDALPNQRLLTAAE